MDLDNHFFKLYDFDNLYDAHCAARKSKRSNREVIEFELNLGSNIVSLAQSRNNGGYKTGGDYKFRVFDLNKRVIHALHYVDRVVQHCLCDQILAPVIEPRLIYDNAACRICKGTSFVYKRVTYFLHEFYKKHGNKGYFLRCDIQDQDQTQFPDPGRPEIAIDDRPQHLRPVQGNFLDWMHLSIRNPF